MGHDGRRVISLPSSLFLSAPFVDRSIVESSVAQHRHPPLFDLAKGILTGRLYPRFTWHAGFRFLKVRLLPPALGHQFPLGSGQSSKYSTSAYCKAGWSPKPYKMTAFCALAPAYVWVAMWVGMGHACKPLILWTRRRKRPPPYSTSSVT